MPRNNSRDAMAAEYDKLKGFDDKVRAEKEHNALLDAKQAEEAARQAKREEAAETTRNNRTRKSTKAQEEYKQKHKEFKAGSLKAYDNFVAAMMEIATLMQAWSNSINADIWALAGGPMKDWLTSNLHDLGAVAIACATEVAEHRELASVLEKNPIEMVQVNSDGGLEFELFKDDPVVKAKIDKAKNEGKIVPENFLENADHANRAAMMFLVRKAGYDYDSVQDNFKKNGQPLDKDALENIVKSADFEALIGDALENNPAAPTFGM